jgi:hypothetical protein
MSITRGEPIISNDFAAKLWDINTVVQCEWNWLLWQHLLELDFDEGKQIWMKNVDWHSYWTCW